jgi:hypothetical protein
VACVGFALSLLVHVLSCLSIPLGLGKAPWLLHIGIFVVWIPTIIVLVGETRARIGWQQVLEALRPAQRWFRFATWVVIGYGALSFVLFGSGWYGDMKDEVVTLRAFSGLWMIPYWLALVFLRVRV